MSEIEFFPYSRLDEGPGLLSSASVPRELVSVSSFKLLPNSPAYTAFSSSLLESQNPPGYPSS